MLKELRKLQKIKESGEAQMRFDGFTPETIEKRIEEEKNKIVKNINSAGWFIVFLIFIPLALMQLGLSSDLAIYISYITAGILFGVVLPRITGRRY